MPRLGADSAERAIRLDHIYGCGSSVQWGSFYMDNTNKRELISVGTSAFVAPPPPVIRLYFFFDKSRQYLYNPATGACTESPLLLTLTPFGDGCRRRRPPTAAPPGKPCGSIRSPDRWGWKRRS